VLRNAKRWQHWQIAPTPNDTISILQREGSRAARKLLIALWRLVRDGVVPDGVILRPAQ